MTEVERIAVARNIAAPILVVPLARIGPVPLVTIVIFVSRIIRLYVTLAKIAQPPSERLAYGHAVLCPEVEPRRGAKSVRTLLSAPVSGQVVDILGKKVCSPSG